MPKEIVDQINKVVSLKEWKLAKAELVLAELEETIGQLDLDAAKAELEAED
jgi:hypothetical protein